jgi:hypothetical protein
MNAAYSQVGTKMGTLYLHRYRPIKKGQVIEYYPTAGWCHRIAYFGFLNAGDALPRGRLSPANFAASQTIDAPIPKLSAISR